MLNSSKINKNSSKPAIDLNAKGSKMISLQDKNPVRSLVTYVCITTGKFKTSQYAVFNTTLALSNATATLSRWQWHNKDESCALYNLEGLLFRWHLKGCQLIRLCCSEPLTATAKQYGCQLFSDTHKALRIASSFYGAPDVYMPKQKGKRDSVGHVLDPQMGELRRTMWGVKWLYYTSIVKLQHFY